MSSLQGKSDRGGEMKAKDTVMSWERIRMVLQKQDELLQHDPMFRLEAIAKSQSEISFKAGIKEGYNAGLDDGKQAGIADAVRGVLDYIESMFPELESTYWQGKNWKRFRKEQALSEGK